MAKFKANNISDLSDHTKGVVDGNLNVFGVKNLMVADNSVMPRITSGNTAMPAYYIGAVAAKILGGVVPERLTNGSMNPISNSEFTSLTNECGEIHY